MLTVQAFVAWAGMLAILPSRGLLRDLVFAFTEVKSILCPASDPTFVMLFGILQYAGWTVTVVVSLHLTTASATQLTLI